MLDDDNPLSPDTTDPAPATQPQPAPRTRRRAASRPAGPPAPLHDERPEPSRAAAEPVVTVGAPGSKAPQSKGESAKRAPRKSAKKAASSAGGSPSEATGAAAHATESAQLQVAAPAAAAAVATDVSAVEGPEAPGTQPAESVAVQGSDAAPSKKAAKKSAAKRPSKKMSKQPDNTDADLQAAAAGSQPVTSADLPSSSGRAAGSTSPFTASDDTSSVDAGAPTVAVPLLFQPPDITKVKAQRSAAKKPTARSAGESPESAESAGEPGQHPAAPADVAGGDDSDGGEDQAGSSRRRRSRGGRNRRKPTDSVPDDQPKNEAEQTTDSNAAAGSEAEPADGEESSTRRRRRRRRTTEGGNDVSDDAVDTVVKVRQPRAKKDSVSTVDGSTRIEAKKQRRREGREAGRRRAPILSESEFLARREAVARVMTIRQRGEMTQIAVLEDDILVEHYVALESQSSIMGNVYLGRVQNVLPSMEAAFIDIGKGKNAVLYAGEVNWDLREDTNQPRRIENALKPGQAVLVQVSKDPIAHKGARLTSQISLPGRYLVYVPGGGASGISRKLPDTERTRLKNLLKDILPDDANVIIRTAAEGASEEELTRDVTRLTARWEDIEKKAKKGQAPQLLYAEPDTTLRVVRDLFTEDFSKLVIHGDEAWDMVEAYVQHIAPDLTERLERWTGDQDLFDAYRVDEQIAKAMERKVWLPSGGSLVIDRTEAMTVVDVNTGKFTGSGGNLEETVTKNNLEAAEEIVRQLRLRDIGGIIVVDFIDMVLESNRDLVLRRLVECLGRDRTRHQVAEVTSLGLVQMTRKRISTGLIEAFSEPCEHCNGRGVVIQPEPVVLKNSEHARGGRPNSDSHLGGQDSSKQSGRRRGGRSAGTPNNAPSSAAGVAASDPGGSGASGASDAGATNGAAPAPTPEVSAGHAARSPEPVQS